MQSGRIAYGEWHQGYSVSCTTGMNVAFITGKRQASHMQYGELAAVLHLSSISTKGLSQQKRRKPVAGVSQRQTL